MYWEFLVKDSNGSIKTIDLYGNLDVLILSLKLKNYYIIEITELYDSENDAGF